MPKIYAVSVYTIMYTYLKLITTIINYINLQIFTDDTKLSIETQYAYSGKIVTDLYRSLDGGVPLLIKKVYVVLFKSIFFTVISGQNICLLFLLSILKNLRESGRTQVKTKVFSQVLKVKKQN